MELADNSSDSEDLKHSEEDRLYNNNEFRAIMIRLGFLPNSNPNEHDEQLIRDLWALVRLEV